MWLYDPPGRPNNMPVLSDVSGGRPLKSCMTFNMSLLNLHDNCCIPIKANRKTHSPQPTILLWISKTLFSTLYETSSR
ncbi:hypothetical protein TNCV_3123831 [Trichonephila clavipes]|nr:hypothetical protein TNCV_3123831 [Trichonephila clavipes]